VKTVWKMVRTWRADCLRGRFTFAFAALTGVNLKRSRSERQARALLQGTTGRDLADIGLTEGDRFALLSQRDPPT
jgi:uncharacterized protein YjiS (DUF1127 family)